MPLKTKILEEFEHAHEERGFNELAELLRPQFESAERDIWLLGNLICNGEELDALLIKNDAIIVIELKNYGGEITANENGPWFSNGYVEVIGGSKENPFRQVRAYKIGLMRKLNEFFRCSDQNRKPGLNFGHISGLVYFQQEVVIRDTLSSTIKRWFSINCPSTIRTKVATQRSAELNISATLVEDILKLLGALKPNKASSKPKAKSPAPEKEKKHARSVTVRGLGFNESLIRLKSQGGAAGNAAREFDQIRHRIRQVQPVFAPYTFEKRGEIDNGVLFEIVPGYRLVVVQTPEVNYICYLGSDIEVDHWIEQHSGMLLTYDADTGEVKKTYKHPKQSIDGHAPHASRKPYLKQINNFDLGDFIEDDSLISELEEIGEHTDPKDFEIRLLRLQILDPDLARDLKELFTLIRNGDFEAAQARVNLIYGVAIPVEDAGELQVNAIDENANSETLIDLAELDDNEWERLLDKTRFREWLVYLHKGQKRIVKEDYSQPIELHGVSGSGKTCVLAHRARRLANLYKEPVLILTLNRSLARLIENLINDLCVEDEKPQIKVEAYYEYVTRLLKTVGLKDYIETLGVAYEIDAQIQNFLSQATPEVINQFFEFRENTDIKKQWTGFIQEREESMLLSRIRNLLSRNQENIDCSRYIFEEFELIRSAFVFDRGYQGYDQENNFDRSGRSIALRSPQRSEFLSLLKLWEKSQFIAGKLDHMTLSQAAAWALDEYGTIPDSLRYRCVLVDEYQDFSTLDLKLIHEIPTESENGLFLTGDTGQKIYAKDFNLKKAGIDSTFRRINKNYRNSREILECGYLLLKHYCDEATAKNEGVKILKPEYAMRGSAKPFACKTNHTLLAAWQIAEEWLEAGNQAFSVCIATANTDVYSIEDIQSHAPDGIDCATLTGDYMLNTDRVITSDIQNVKGFEFSLIIIVGLEKDVFPSKGFAEREVWRDALRLYVAITRARDEACIIYNGEPSDFLKVMQDALSEKEILFSEDEITSWSETTADPDSATIEEVYTKDEADEEAEKPEVGLSAKPEPEIEIKAPGEVSDAHEEQSKPSADKKSEVNQGPRPIQRPEPVVTPSASDDEVQILNGIPVISVRLPATTMALASALGKGHKDISYFFMWKDMHFRPTDHVPEGWIKQLFWEYRCVPKFIGENPRRKQAIEEKTPQVGQRPRAQIKTNEEVSFRNKRRKRCRNAGCNNFAMDRDDYCYSCNIE